MVSGFHSGYPGATYIITGEGGPEGKPGMSLHSRRRGEGRYQANRMGSDWEQWPSVPEGLEGRKPFGGRNTQNNKRSSLAEGSGREPFHS